MSWKHIELPGRTDPDQHGYSIKNVIWSGGSAEYRARIQQPLTSANCELVRWNANIRWERFNMWADSHVPPHVLRGHRGVVPE